MKTWLDDWNWFWFTPRDPLVLGALRICAGLLTFYTLAMYSLDLQELVGESAWLDRQIRMKMVEGLDHEVFGGRPNLTEVPSKLDPIPKRPPAIPQSPQEKKFCDEYEALYGAPPPGPIPQNEQQQLYTLQFRQKYQLDLQLFGLYPPRNGAQEAYLDAYMALWKVPPARYPLKPGTEEIDEKLAAQVDEYLWFHQTDPFLPRARGMTVFSFWFHVTNPTDMWVIHAIFVLASLLFTLGVCTRVTSAITWFGALSYIHRSPNILFGVDTMMMILLFYLMIGPSGAALSLDRLFARMRGEPSPPPTVVANFTVRLLQVHLCIIYFLAGVSKLLGETWWRGSAVWFTLITPEYSPMESELFVAMLRFLGQNPYLLETTMTIATGFTLLFELSYPFLIWNRRLRWAYLGGAIFLHGLIGMFMGLKTFAWMMLAMNIVFVPERALEWLRVWEGQVSKEAVQTQQPPLP